jgi:hypothetical protein
MLITDIREAAWAAASHDEWGVACPSGRMKPNGVVHIGLYGTKSRVVV